MTTTTTPKKVTEPKSMAALTVGPGRFGPVAYAGGVIIEGLPAAVVEANAAWLDADPAKVREARRAGAAVVRYQG